MLGKFFIDFQFYLSWYIQSRVIYETKRLATDGKGFIKVFVVFVINNIKKSKTAKYRKHNFVGFRKLLKISGKYKSAYFI